MKGNQDPTMCMSVLVTAWWPNHTVQSKKHDKIRDLKWNHHEAHSANPYPRNNYKLRFRDPRKEQHVHEQRGTLPLHSNRVNLSFTSGAVTYTQCSIHTGFWLTGWMDKWEKQWVLCVTSQLGMSSFIPLKLEKNKKIKWSLGKPNTNKIRQICGINQMCAWVLLRFHCFLFGKVCIIHCHTNYCHRPKLIIKTL